MLLSGLVLWIAFGIYMLVLCVIFERNRHSANLSIYAAIGAAFVAVAAFAAWYPAKAWMLDIPRNLDSMAKFGDATAGLFAGAGLIFLTVSIGLQAWELSQNRVEQREANRQSLIQNQIEHLKMRFSLMQARQERMHVVAESGGFFAPAFAGSESDITDETHDGLLVLARLPIRKVGNVGECRVAIFEPQFDKCMQFTLANGDAMLFPPGLFPEVVPLPQEEASEDQDREVLFRIIPQQLGTGYLQGELKLRTNASQAPYAVETVFLIGLRVFINKESKRRVDIDVISTTRRLFESWNLSPAPQLTDEVAEEELQELSTKIAATQSRDWYA
ncbi:MAG: hypothetical protein V3W41_03780 [Planctomycetota bacterium]